MPPNSRILEIGLVRVPTLFVSQSEGTKSLLSILQMSALPDVQRRRRNLVYPVGLSSLPAMPKLDGIPRGFFDAVLIMGPLYHLVLEADRTTALQSAYDRLRSGEGFLPHSYLDSAFSVTLSKRIPPGLRTRVLLDPLPNTAAYARVPTASGHSPLRCNGRFVSAENVRATGNRSGKVALYSRAVSFGNPGTQW